MIARAAPGQRALFPISEAISMFATPAYAAAPNAGASSGAAFFVQMLPLLLIFVLFYFLMIRPQQQRMKKHQEAINAVQRGDSVVTAGGLIGRVTRVGDTEVEVEIAPNTRVQVVKTTLSEVRSKNAKAAND